MNKTNKKAITPIVASVLLVVVAVILITVIISWGKDFSNKSLATADTEKLTKSNASEFVYTKAFSDGIIQFNYGPPDSLTNQNIVITGYKIFSDNNETTEIILDSNYTLSQGLNIIPLTSFSDQNITSRKMNIQLKTSDGKYITLNSVTNNEPYVAPPPPEPCSIIPENGEIYYLEHLDYIDTNATTLAGSYTLQKDLNFLDNSSYCQPATYKTTWTTGTGFTPIGTSVAPFTGAFDGNNFKISNLYINRPTTDYVGLFGFVQTKTIKNIEIENLYIVGRDNVGGLLGGTYNTSISNSSSNGFVIGHYYLGGLVGSSYAGTVSNSFSNCSVDGNSFIGGLIGNDSDSSYIFNNYSTGPVSGINYVGGLIGSQTDGEINNCFSIGSASGIMGVGGFAGTSRNGIIQNSYSLGNVTRISGSDTSFGGFITFNSTWGEVSNCYSTGRVIYVGATNPTDRGFSVGGVGSGNYWDMTTSLQTTSGNGTGKITSQMKTQGTFTGWNFTTVWNIAEATYPYLRNNTEKLIPSITNPANDSEYQGGININFVGTAINPQGDYTCSWDSNYDGSLGTGCNINVGTLSYRKTHKITLSVTDEEQTKTTYIYAIIGDTYGDP